MRQLLASGTAITGDLHYDAEPGEVNNVILSPGHFFSIQDSADVALSASGGCSIADYLRGIGISVDVSVGGSFGVGSEVSWGVGVGLGVPLIPMRLPDGMICPNPANLTTAPGLTDALQQTFSTETRGVASAVAGAAVTQAGSVYYEVKASNATLDEYRFYQAIVDPATAYYESEVNDQFATANTIAANRLVVGDFSAHTKDVDYYKFTATAGDRLALVLDNDPDRDGNFTNSRIAIYGVDGKELASNVSFSDGSATAAVTADKTGVYYAAVADNGYGKDNDYRFVAIKASSGINENIAKPRTFTSGAINLAIPDADPNGVAALLPVDVGSPFALADSMEVTLNIDHTYDGDLAVTLESPAGTLVNLVLHRGGSGDNFVGTVFRDDLGLPLIGSGAAPFTGAYRPENALSGFASDLATGGWKLHVVDTVVGNAGTLKSWSLKFNVKTNETASDADPLGVTQYAQGAAPSDVDRDWFKVTDASVQPGRLVFAFVDTADTDGANAAQNDSFLTVLGADGTTVLGSDDDDGPMISGKNFDAFKKDLKNAGVDIDAGATFSGDLVVSVADGNDVVDASKVNLVGQKVIINGGAGNDLILGSGGDQAHFNGDDGNDTFIFNNNAPATVALAGGSGNDALNVNGTDGNDTIAVMRVGADLVVSVNGMNATYKNIETASIEALNISGGDGDDTILVDFSAGVMPFTQGIGVDGGGGQDVLTVYDDGPGQCSIWREGPDPRSGTITIGALAPVEYEGIEHASLQPFDAVRDGYGGDGQGRLVVIPSDPLENNNTRRVASDFNLLQTLEVRPSIDPPADYQPGIPADEDWYRFVASKTGTYRFQLAYEPIGTLPNGAAGLPGAGQLTLTAYDQDGNPIGRIAGEGAAANTIGVEAGKTYYVRVRGATTDAVNIYGIDLVDVDVTGVQVTNVAITGANWYNLFTQEKAGLGHVPTPLVYSLTLSVRDLVARYPGFLYPALEQAIDTTPGHYHLVGDANGIIPIASVSLVNDAVSVGNVPTGRIVLNFTEPLPDDRYTLTLADSILDPAGNRLDGESNADEPRDNPQFPSGDGLSGGDFVARFTVDSRPEIGVWDAGSIYLDTNGNMTFDPTNTDATNRDTTYVLGFTADHVLAGNFAAAAGDTADGFQKLAIYGMQGSAFRWMIDTDNNGTPNLVVNDLAGVVGTPIAANFDGNAANGDEVGLFDGTTWYLDGTHDYQVANAAGDRKITSVIKGLPLAGDFDGDGLFDLATWNDNKFYFDLGANGYGNQDAVIDGVSNFGFLGARTRPVSADMDQDGITDVGLWLPDRSGADPLQVGEWYFLVSNDPAGLRRAAGSVNTLAHAFLPVPFGKDRFGRLGNAYAIPVVGNFDPPVTADGTTPIVDPTPAIEMSRPGLYDPATGLFYLRNSNSTGAADICFGFGPATPNLNALSGDWDGDGLTTVGLYDQDTGMTYLRNSATTGVADVAYPFGVPKAGWIPVVGDWDGDGRDTLGLYEPKTSVFYLTNGVQGGVADVAFGFGAPGAGWLPLSGDWNGDGKDTVALFDPQTSIFFFIDALGTKPADYVAGFGAPNAGWLPIVGDWNGDGYDTMALYDPSTAVFYQRNTLTQGIAETAFGYGPARNGWVPLSGDWDGPHVQALHADSLGQGVADPTLTLTQIQLLAQAAQANWSQTGLAANALSDVRYVVANLPGTMLGAVSGHTIYLDVNAAGHGWFVDPTPALDEEFTRLGSNTQLTAINPQAADRIDLLTLLEHELGHLAGLPDRDASATSLMSGSLTAGVRRIVTASEADALFATPDVP